jgi:predicted metal-binding membrane protein
MRSSMQNGIVLTKRERRDRAAVVLVATFISVLAWAFLFYRSWVTQRIDFAVVVMPGIGDWTSRDLLMVFAIWAIMMVAMMVPPVTPMLLSFATISSNRLAQAPAFVPWWVFLAGYLVFWMVFGILATLAQWGLHSLALLSPTMGSTSPLVGSLLLMAAGIYQWTTLKQACLSHYQRPSQFLLTRGRHHDGKAAFRMGLRHGACCLGSCWLLMAVLFAVGAMNLAWIAGLSVFMLLEKILPREFRVAKVAGLILTASGAWMALSAGG